MSSIQFGCEITLCNLFFRQPKKLNQGILCIDLCVLCIDLCTHSKLLTLYSQVRAPRALLNTNPRSKLLYFFLELQCYPKNI